jgi:NADH-quinone oxidoreductase subunit G
VFIPVSLQTERRGHYTNFAGCVNRFDACFAIKPGVAHAEELFTRLSAKSELTA